MSGLPILDGPTKVQTPRRSERQRVENLMYVDLGAENGGFPLNLTEHGMAFQGIRPLKLNQEIEVTFKLAGVAEPVTALARTVWLSESRKGGALEFIDLPDATRELIRDWLLLQREAEPSTKIVAPKKMGPIEGLVLPPAYSIPPAPTLTASPAQPAAIQAAAAPISLPAAPELKPEVALKADSRFQPETEKPAPRQGHPLDHQELADFQPPIPTTSKRPGHKRKLRWTSSVGFGLAASIAIVIAGGVVLWLFRATLLHPPVKNTTAPASIESPAPVSSSPNPEDLPLAQSSNEPQIDPAPQIPAVTDGQESQGIVPLPETNASMKPTAHAVVKAALAPPRAVRENSKENRHLSGSTLQLRRPARLASQNEAPLAGSSNSIPETSNELPGGAIEAGKIAALEVKTTVMPAPATGSSEIILDPYPSIRMPAQAQKRSSGPGTSLRIGRLLTRVEPVYPAEALRQRIGGTVKAHVLIGPDGVVESSEVADAPALFAEPALRAIRQLRFEPTLLGGTAIGVEEDITVAFRIAAPRSPAN